ncbi:XPB/Ssl2-like helicase family protein [Homoserinimonas aerilata]|uniref:XPB/Ssl2-like helicase family protein n=1 Tax=Homoserinimonas aerilata TaxID=1162970 RepID=A0A542YG43_9MICO|nr:helicase-associated domain-containing protein [Homoserinimonas aerilata]TQL47060.1 XPB/Ssl2-like helicase family protein [Homoserinimonas aerilata]
MSSTLSLATRLRSLGDEQLHEAITARELVMTPSTLAGMADFFDLADVLLDHSAIQRALVRLDRGMLSCLAVLADSGQPLTPDAVAERLRGLGSEHPDPAALRARLDRAAALLLAEESDGAFDVYDGVREQLRSWPVFGLPGLEQLAGTTAPAALEPVPEVERRFVDRLAAERAFASTGAVTELLFELERQPARELAKGGVALPDAKRLASTMSVDLDTVGVYLHLAERGGLACRESGTWMTTERGSGWLGRPVRSRWRALGDAWFGMLPPDIRQLLGERSHSVWGDGLRSYLDWLYPAGVDWVGERIAAYVHEAELLGITAGQAPSSPGALLLQGRGDDAEQAVRELLPAEVDSVYLQHDLSVVAPGPLEPAIDERLRVLADVENHALAATYRVSAASVNRALTAGETAESMREFLSAISKTGIPQPLDYLITEGATRYGLIRAGELSGEADPDSPEAGAHSYLRSSDAHLLRTVAVDQSLAALGLVRVDDHRLVSRFARDIVFWSLSDARYPVAAEDAQGEIVALRRHRLARPPRPDAPDALHELIARLRADAQQSDSAGEPSGQAWLVKQLEAAVRSRSVLTVSIRMPGGAIVDYRLEPTGIAGGRLRARDTAGDVERTLPVSSIASISPAD